MDILPIITEILRISPFAAIALYMIYTLWKKLTELIQSHADDRKETQEKMFQIVNQNSASHLQLATSVDNLAKSVVDSGKNMENRLTAVEQKVERTNRSQRSSAAKAAAA
ncbi:hypothetical protein [Spirosoma oryzicola]|uniref:hypothetical protein n=1 Tax=Spirosoma oryzicola TaxID=2898794 RepID=UPI001E538230|nr:hypothetical protein [Spirosoma oryzicola]UHG93435.1 hypothetical protein LQ777_11135 [Spirosoma oryzicola]